MWPDQHKHSSIPKSIVRVHLPDYQKATILAERGVTIKEAMHKKLTLFKLSPEMYDVWTIDRESQINWEDDISKYENQDIQIELKDQWPLIPSISHNFSEASLFFGIRLCDVCKSYMIQGLYCDICNFKFHSKCAMDVPLICDQSDLNLEKNCPDRILLNNMYRKLEQHIRDIKKKDFIDPNESSDKSIQERQIDETKIHKESKIASGSFGDVYIGYLTMTSKRQSHFHNDKVALKKLKLKNPSPKQLEAFEKEIRVLDLVNKTRHVNVLKFRGFTLKDEQLTIVTELCDNSSLYEHLHVKETKFNLKQRIKISKQIAQGINYLHEKRNLMHLDIKSPNIFLNKDLTVKIGDFGLATFKKECTRSEKNFFLNSVSPCTIIGSIPWMSPEIILQKNASFKSDVYSFAVCLFEIFSEKLPYQKEDGYKLEEGAIIYGVGRGKLRPDLTKCQKETPCIIYKLIEDCIQFEEEKRPSFDQILMRLHFL